MVAAAGFRFGYFGPRFFHPAPQGLQLLCVLFRRAQSGCSSGFSLGAGDGGRRGILRWWCFGRCGCGLLFQLGKVGLRVGELLPQLLYALG